jgi:CBS domain-containing protein
VDVRQVVFARRQETIAEAARRMRDFHVGTLVVIDGQDGRRLPVGVLTDRDLVVRVLAHDTPFGEARVVGDVMNSAGPFACSARGSDVDRRVCGRNT